MLQLDIELFMVSNCTNLIYKKPEVALALVVILFFSLVSCEFFTNTRDPDPEMDQLVDSISLHLEYVKKDDSSKEEILSHLSGAFELTKIVSSDTIRKNKLKEIRKNYSRLNIDTAYIKINNEIRLINNKLSDSSGMADWHLSTGYFYWQKEQMDSAFNHYYRAERFYAQLGDRLSAGKAMLSMAILQKNVRDYIGSETSSIKALEYFEATNSLRYLASANNNLGIILKEVGDYDKSLYYHVNAREYRASLDDNKFLEVGSLNNIGTVYTKKKDYNKAISYYDLGLSSDSLFDKKPKTYARLLDNRAYAQFLSGEKGNFPELFLKPLAIRDSISDNSGIITNSLHLAEYYISNDSLFKAHNYAKVALDRAKPLKKNREILKALQFLIETSNQEEVLFYSKAYMRISDSLQRKDWAYQNHFARIRFETETIEIENSKVTRQNKNLIIVLLVLVASFLLVYTFIQRKLSIKELRFRQSQQEASEELYNLMLAQQAKLEEGKQLEKQRISEELHDGVLGKLFGTRLSLDSLNHKKGDEVVEARSKYINELQNIENEIRQISHDLNSAIFTPDVLFTEAIEQLVESQSLRSEKKSIKCRFIDDYFINWDEVQNDVKIHLYRIIQESLQNIHKHARANNVLISFSKEKSKVLLKIEDDGVGMAIEKVKKGIGLKNIKSRVKQMKGNLRVESVKGKGTIIYVKVTP